MDLNATAKECYAIAINRNQKPEKGFKHLATEVIEATEAKAWYENTGLGYNLVGEELADVIICTLSLSAYYGIDIEEAIKNKIKINSKRKD